MSTLKRKVNGTWEVVATKEEFPVNIPIQITEVDANIDTITNIGLRLSSNSISVSNLKGQPLWFVLFRSSQSETGSQSKALQNVSYDGTTLRGSVISASGTYNIILPTAPGTDFSITAITPSSQFYSSGTLTITFSSNTVSSVGSSGYILIYGY